MTLTLLHGRPGQIIGLVLLAVGIALPFAAYPIFAIDVLCFALAAVALDLLLGFTGLLSFGHAMFWGGAGYVATILMTKTGANFIEAVVAAALYAALLALLVGALAVRRTGIYFAMVTLGIAEIQYFLCYQLTDLTGAENGLQLANRGAIFGLSLSNDRVYYYLVLVIVALATMLAIRVVASPFGAVLAAMSQNEPRARSIGYDTDRYKLAVFVMSGTLAGLAGALYCIGNELAGLDGVHWKTSGAFVIMTILGGIGTIYGPIVGAAIYQTVEYFVTKTPIADETNMVMGFIFAVVILLARRGIVGEILERIRRSRPQLVQDEERPDVLVPERV